MTSFMDDPIWKDLRNVSTVKVTNEIEPRIFVVILRIVLSLTCLVNFLLGVIEEWREVWKSVTVENELRLLVGACHDVADRPERGRLHLDLPMREEGHKFWNDTGINNHLNLVIAAIRKIAQSPYGIHKDLKKYIKLWNRGKPLFFNLKGFYNSWSTLRFTMFFK